MALKTPLYNRHMALQARMVEFAGYLLPVQYSGIKDEHIAVRESAGLFDVSHMGEIFAMGPQAEAFVQHLVTNDVTRLKDGQAQYTVMCNENGGIMDDLLVYRLNAETFMLVVNAANTASDLAWMEANNPNGVTLYDASDQIALLALQGPRSIEIARQLTAQPVADLGYYHFMRPAPGNFMGFNKVIISRTGYTGELGLEMYVESENAVELWDAIMDAGKDKGLKPAGIGARDTLRLEAGFCLYGQDLTVQNHPFQARLGFVTKLEKGEFIGREALRACKAAKPERVLVGLIMEERGIPRPGYRVLTEKGDRIGIITSGSQSPILERGIALAYVDNDPTCTALGSMLKVSIRGKNISCTVARPPFHKAAI